jgi:hypothetical protein
MRIIIMEWVPVVFVTFKVLVLGVGMYFAIKWHYDRQENGERGAAPRMAGKMAALFLLSLLCVGLFAFILSRMLGLDLSL